MQTTEWSANALLPTGSHVLWNRDLTGSESSGDGDGTMDSLNLIFIVGFAVLITVLARFLSGRGSRRK